MSVFNKIAKQLTKANVTATACATKPLTQRNPYQTAVNKIITRLEDSIKMAKSGNYDAKRACYTVKASNAIIGAKYGNAYLVDSQDNKFVTVPNDSASIEKTLQALIDAVQNKLFDTEINAAVAHQQELSKQRYAKRK